MLLMESDDLQPTKSLDLAVERGVNFFDWGTPVWFMADVHCTAASQSFLALEHHSVENRKTHLSNRIGIEGQPSVKIVAK